MVGCNEEPACCSEETTEEEATKVGDNCQRTGPAGSSGRMNSLTAHEAYSARRAERARELHDLRGRVRSLMVDEVERYSAEVTDELGLDVRRRCPTVAYALAALEREGVLTSRLKRAPRSGLGRRYYRWASAVARDRAGADGEAQHG